MSKPTTTAFYLSKGGTGKTTLAAQFAVYLAEQGQRVAIFDLDRQGTQTDVFGVFDVRPAYTPDGEAFDQYVRIETMHAALKRELDAAAALRLIPGEWPGELYLLPGGALTPEAVEQLKLNPTRFGMVNTATIVSQLIEQLTGLIDHVVIDMGPSDPMLSTAALVAADHLIIPMEPSQSSLERLDYVLKEVDNVRRNGYEINVAGIVQNKVLQFWGGLRVATTVKLARESLIANYSDLLLRDRHGKPVEIPTDQDWEYIRYTGQYQISQVSEIKDPVKHAAKRFSQAVFEAIEGVVA